MNIYLEPQPDSLVMRPAKPWTAEKLDYLRRYLAMFTTSMRERPWRALNYIDLFAGPGKCQEGNGNVLLGSPLLALTTSKPFHHYFFVDCDACQAMGQPNYANGFQLTLHPAMLERPLAWKKPQMIFVNSMSDLFHEDVPLDFIQQVFAVMRQASWHTFQVLTKRGERLAALDEALDWPDNVWMGVTVENYDYIARIDALRQTHAAVKFLSLEPLLGPLPDINLRAIDWVIVGGESGPGARPLTSAWVTDLRDQCLAAHIPFFFKQWGGARKKQAGRLLEGRQWNQMPAMAGI